MLHPPVAPLVCKVPCKLAGSCFCSPHSWYTSFAGLHFKAPTQLGVPFPLLVVLFLCLEHSTPDFHLAAFVSYYSSFNSHATPSGGPLWAHSNTLPSSCAPSHLTKWLSSSVYHYLKYIIYLYLHCLHIQNVSSVRLGILSALFTPFSPVSSMAQAQSRSSGSVGWM